MSEEDEMVEALEESGVFEGEVYFSTDGKHTVHAKASTPAGRREMLDWSFKAYGRIKEKLGTKAEMWGDVIKKNGEKETKVDPNAPICEVHNKPMSLKPAGVSKTTNKPYPAFWACSEKMPDGSFCKFRPGQNIA